MPQANVCTATPRLDSSCVPAVAPVAILNMDEFLERQARAKRNMQLATQRVHETYSAAELEAKSNRKRRYSDAEWQAWSGQKMKEEMIASGPACGPAPKSSDPAPTSGAAGHGEMDCAAHPAPTHAAVSSDRKSVTKSSAADPACKDSNRASTHAAAGSDRKRAKNSSAADPAHKDSNPDPTLDKIQSEIPYLLKRSCNQGHGFVSLRPVGWKALWSPSPAKLPPSSDPAYPGAIKSVQDFFSVINRTPLQIARPDVTLVLDVCCQVPQVIKHDGLGEVTLLEHTGTHPAWSLAMAASAEASDILRCIQGLLMSAETMLTAPGSHVQFILLDAERSHHHSRAWALTLRYLFQCMGWHVLPLPASSSSCTCNNCTGEWSASLQTTMRTRLYNTWIAAGLDPAPTHWS